MTASASRACTRRGGQPALDHLQQLVRTLRERDVVLRCIREGIDTAGPHGQIVRAAPDIVIDLRREERIADLLGVHRSTAYRHLKPDEDSATLC